jgi:hypothetical protein
MTGHEFIRCFEGDALPGNAFHHADHVRLALAYLSQYPVLQALERFSGALKQFATARGKPQLYHRNHHARLFLFDPGADGAGWGDGMGGVRGAECGFDGVEGWSSRALLSGRDVVVGFGSGSVCLSG